MSLRLVLSHYLTGLRERDELDALLPDLLGAMGHAIESVPQRGPGQAGVDVLSLFNGEVYLWVVKFGDVGRSDLFVGQQGIDASVREAATDFVEHRLDAQRRALPIHIIVVSNGVLRQEARSPFTSLVDQIRRNHHVHVDFWGLDALARLIEQHLFDERLLLGPARAHLRVALAGLDESETAIHRFARFVDECLASPSNDVAVGDARRKRDFLRRCAAAGMGYGVLAVWGRTEDNLKAGVVCGEYLLLHLWASAVAADCQDDADFLAQISAVLRVFVDGLQQYFQKVMPSLVSPRALARYRRNHVFYAQLLFEELGRLGIVLLMMHVLGAPADVREDARHALVAVINAHPAAMRPVLDEQGIDLSLVLAALLIEGDHANAKAIARNVVLTFRRALVDWPEFLPIDTDLLEDAIAAQVEGSTEDRAYFEISSCLPMLATVAVSTDDEELLTLLRDLEPRLEGVSLEQWWPSTALETLTGSRQGVADVGVSRTLEGFRKTVAEHALFEQSPPDGAARSEDFRWYNKPWEILVALSARLHRHPLPTWFMARAAGRQLATQALAAPTADEEVPDEGTA